jgi:hypothetical protein
MKETQAGFDDLADEDTGRDTIPDMEFYQQQDPGATKAGFAAPEGAAEEESTPESRRKHFDDLMVGAQPSELDPGVIEKRMDSAGFSPEERAEWWKGQEAEQKFQADLRERHRAVSEAAITEQDRKEAQEIEAYEALLAELGDRTVSPQEYGELKEKHGIPETKLTGNVMFTTGRLGELKDEAFRHVNLGGPEAAPAASQKPKKKKGFLGLWDRLRGK